MGSRGINYPSPDDEGFTSNVSSPMIKSVSALAIIFLFGSAVAALSILAPPVKASTAVAMSKADRGPVGSADRHCLQQVWPDFETSCLRSNAAAPLREARLVTARR